MSEVIRKRNITIIAEGYEEKPYLDKILSFPNINKEIYNIKNPINVKGNGNIFARYQYEVQSGFADIVLIFCDADKGRDQFLSIVNKIGESFFIKKEKAIEVFMFSNPVTLQIVLSHFGDVSLTKISKKSNAEIVKKLTGIEDYDANQNQISEMINKIHYSSLNDFKKRISILSKSINDVPSSNFLIFLDRFENEDTSWIDSINSLKK